MIIRSHIRSLVRGVSLSPIAGEGAGGGAAPFDPASLFAASEVGVIYDFTDAANLFQLSTGSTAVTTNDPIGYVTDLSPNAKPALQATAASRPNWSGVPRTLGSELAPALSTWTAGTGFSESGGTVTAVAGSASVLSVALSLTAGKVYKATFVITRTAGTVVARLTGGTTVTGVSRSSAGSFTDELLAVTGNTTFEFSKDATFAGTIRLVSIKEVTSFVLMGARSDASAAFMQSATMNASGSDKMTLVLGFRSGQIATLQTVMATGTYLTSLTGSTEASYSSGWLGRLRGDTNFCSSQPPAGDTPIALNPQDNAQTYSFDLAGASIATEVNVRTRGFLPTQTTAGTTAGGGNMANSFVTVMRGGSGSNRLQGVVRRAIAINRTLTAEEITNAETWVREGMVYAAVLGDSTVAWLSSAVLLPVAMRVSSIVGGLICGAADLADSGDRITNQKTLWTALTGKSALEVVIVQIGQNDVKGRVGENTATSAQVIADYQDLIDTIAADAPQADIYVSALTPSKAWLDTATNPSAAYAAWQALNEAIGGGGTTPITGVAGRITSHATDMNDGSGNLLAAYDYNSDGVHPGNDGRFINAMAWRTKLEADGWLSAT